MTPRPSSHVSIGGPNVTFAQLFEEFLSFSAARGRSPTTLHGYRVVIRGFWLPAIGPCASVR
jgi:hypothetical protein